MGGAFSRAIKMSQLIAAALGLGGIESREALAGIGPYKSRGKGSGKGQASKRTVGQDKRAARKHRSRVKAKRANRK
jgi:hypothetical protein